MRELVCPSFSISIILLTLVHRFRLLVCSIGLSRKTIATRPLVVWDARSSPITFDFVWFLFHFANLSAIHSFYSFDLLIYLDQKKLRKLVPGIASYSKFVTNDELLRRISELIEPLALMTRCVSSVKVVSSKDEARTIVSSYKTVYPRAYSIDLFFPSGFDYISCYSHLTSSDHFRFIDLDPDGIIPLDKSTRSRYLPESCYATFTLRDYGFDPIRNSSKQDLIEFLEFCVSRNLVPVIVPDSDLNPFPSVLLEFPSARLMPDARKHLRIRASLYSASTFNLFTPSGPANLSLHLKNSKTIIYNYAINKDDNSVPAFESIGVSAKSQYFSELDCCLLWHSSFPELSHDALDYALKFLLASRAETSLPLSAS